MSLETDLPGLVARAQANDAGAISELYARYASAILRYLYARVLEPELAQDLTQEVFIKVIRGIGKFEYRDEKSFLGWLYAIASNILISYQRRRNVLSTPLDVQEDLVDNRSQDDVRAVFDRIALRQALDQLTDDQQQVLNLRFFADMSNGEIAKTLNKTEGAIKAIQHRALLSLQKILGREYDAGFAGGRTGTNGPATVVYDGVVDPDLKRHRGQQQPADGIPIGQSDSRTGD